MLLLSVKRVKEKQTISSSHNFLFHYSILTISFKPVKLAVTRKWCENNGYIGFIWAAIKLATHIRNLTCTELISYLLYTKKIELVHPQPLVIYFTILLLQWCLYKTEPVLNGNLSLIETLSIPSNKEHREVASKTIKTPKRMKEPVLSMGVVLLNNPRIYNLKLNSQS
jgi:hypothetical protein